MKLSTLLAATIAAGALVSLVATVAHSAPASAPAADRDYGVRAVPASSNPHEVFMRFVEVPRTPAVAENRDRRELKDRDKAPGAATARPPTG